MAIFRTQGDVNFKNYGPQAVEVESPDEWKGDGDQFSRIDEPSWIQRYKYEAQLITNLCKENNYKKILELGSGPGMLGQSILELMPELDYSYVDKPTAKEAFEKRGFKGAHFYTIDMMHSMDTSELGLGYDLIIANDFLEHIANPSHILYQCRNITKEKSGFFISVPNWRMNHEFIYRGLFDYDNFVYFCKVHGWEPTAVFQSELQCPFQPKQTSEETMPNELITSWNWYFHTEKVN